jgi:hypothetical protein
MLETLQRISYKPQVEISKKAQIPQEKYGENISYLRKKSRETVGSDAFNLEYDAPPTRDELRRDIVSYLGEYRLQAQKYSYELTFGRDRDKRGPITLRDQDQGEAMVYKTKRVIEERKRKGEPIHREEAEDKGIALLNEQLRFAKTGDTVMWASPPGPKEQGYGEYGFIYAGKVTKHTNGQARLAMSAIRIEKPTIEQYNLAFTALTGEKMNAKKAEDFLASPKLIKKNIEEREVDSVLQENFNFSPDFKEKVKFLSIIKQMEPLIEDFLEIMEHGSSAEKLKGFYKLENYALKLKKEYEKEEKIVYQKIVRLNDLEDKYSKKPPIAKGSCGKTGESAKSNNLIIAGRGGRGAGFLLSHDRFGSRAFNCPACGQENIRPENELLSNCQHCYSGEVGC